LAPLVCGAVAGHLHAERANIGAAARQAPAT
jgi:hypothetical protein